MDGTQGDVAEHAVDGSQRQGQAVLTRPEVLPELSGLYYFDDFISESEEQELVNLIDSYPFCEVRFLVEKHHTYSKVHRVYHWRELNDSEPTVR